MPTQATRLRDCPLLRINKKPSYLTRLHRTTNRFWTSRKREAFFHVDESTLDVALRFALGGDV